MVSNKILRSGIFFDWAALPARSDVIFPADKPYFNCYAPVKIMEECATVEDAIALYQEYNEPVFTRAHIMWVDRSGNSAIIEWGENDLLIIRKEGYSQVMTNFNITDPDLACWYPCWRYCTNKIRMNSYLRGCISGFPLRMC